MVATTVFAAHVCRLLLPPPARGARRGSTIIDLECSAVICDTGCEIRLVMLADWVRRDADDDLRTAPPALPFVAVPKFIRCPLMGHCCAGFRAVELWHPLDKRNPVLFRLVEPLTGDANGLHVRRLLFGPIRPWGASGSERRLPVGEYPAARLPLSGLRQADPSSRMAFRRMALQVNCSACFHAAAVQKRQPRPTLRG